MSEAEITIPALYEIALSFDNEEGERVFFLVMPLDPNESDTDIEYLFDRYQTGGRFSLSVRPAAVDVEGTRGRVFPPGPHLLVEGIGGYYSISIGTWFGQLAALWAPRPIKLADVPARIAEDPEAPFEPDTTDLVFVKHVCKEFARTKKLPSGFVS